MVATLLLRSSFRFFKQHPAQLLLSILGIMLGVAIVTAVLITNSSSRTAFRLSAAAISGTTTHQIVGAETGVPESFYVQLRRRLGTPMAPLIEGYLSIDGELLSVIGIDPFANAGLQRSDFELISGSLTPLLSTGNSVLLSQRTQQRLGLHGDTTLSARIDGSDNPLHIAGIYRSRNPAATDGLLICDIATAQQLFSRGRYIDRIDLVLTDAEAAALAAQLPLSLRMIPASTRARTMQDMTRGFQINLTAMSLLALLVGGFLIHNTMTFSILQRRELFATLRIVGLTAGGIFSSILSETLLLSLLGSVLGVAAGYLIAGHLITLTTQTINDLYFVLHVQQIWFSPWLGLGIVALGVTTSLLAAAASAAEAAAISPIQARMRSRLEARVRFLLPLLAIAGLLLMLGGALLAWWPGKSLLLGFAALMALIVGYGLSIPWAVAGISRLLRYRCGKAGQRLAPGLLTAFSLGAIERSISRTGVAIAALAIAVSATFGVDIMIGSFRDTVDRWLRNTLQSDIYITAPGSASTRNDGKLQAQLVQRLLSVEGIEDWSSASSRKVFTSAGNIDMLVLAPHSRSHAGFEFLHGDAQQIWQDFLQRDSVLISQPLATRHGLNAGDTLSIFTAREGDREFAIAGIYYDYGSSHGKITIARSVHDRYWQNRSISSLALNLRAGTDIAATLGTLRTLSRVQQQLLIRSNLKIRQRSLLVFDRTFQVTRVLRLLTVGVAFIGIFSALLALQLERSREFAILRASGATGGEVARIVMLQTLLMGVLAGALALPLGWMMSHVLIKVINLRSFGWSMQTLLPDGALASTLLLAVGSACLAGIYPAWRLARGSIVGQLRDE